MSYPPNRRCEVCGTRYWAEDDRPCPECEERCEALSAEVESAVESRFDIWRAEYGHLFPLTYHETFKAGFMAGMEWTVETTLERNGCAGDSHE